VVPKPVAGPGRVLVAVEAVGVNPVDAGNRADSAWAGLQAPYIVGYEFAGRVDCVGAGVTGFEVGQPVWGALPVRGTCWGTYAEFVAVDARLVAARPASLDAIAAAALPLAGSTALQLLDRLALNAGEWLVVHGAAGGVGSLLVQLAHARGIRVAGLASTPRHALLRELGVEVVLDRQENGVIARAVEQIGGLPDAVADLVGQGLLVQSLPYIAEGGGAVTIVELDGDLDEAIDRNITIHGVLLRPHSATLDRLSEAVNRGTLEPVVDQVLDLASAAAAHRRIETGHGQGKVVLRVAA
jgi:NADPH2:quinone reductase